MDVAGRDCRDPQVAGELAQGGASAGVSALVGALELDEEAVAAEGVGDAGDGVRVARAEPVPRAAGQADEPLGVCEQRLERQLGRERVGALLRPRAGVRLGQEPAEVRVPRRRLDEQRDVRAAGQRQLGAGDRLDAERLGRVGVLQRAADGVVVGERERLVAEVGGARGELVGQRGAVEERIG
jgi:hypothetical protein